MPQITAIEMRLQFVDRPDGRRRITTGGPMPSADADRAHWEAVEAAEQVVRDHGFTIVGVGHGVSAWEYSDANE